MTLSILYIPVAIILYYFGANWLIKGSSAIALRSGISPLVVGLIIVAFGSSAPALAVSMSAATINQGNMAIGNIIGSSLFNICIILGISSIISPLRVKLQLLKIDIPILSAVTILFFVLFHDRHISRFEGFICLALLAIYILVNIFFSRKERTIEVLDEFAGSIIDSKKKYYFLVGQIIIGIVLLVIGSQLLIQGSVTIAHAIGVGETIISITIIAASASLPVLISSVIATMKKQNDIAIGNVIGSNIFILLGTTGLSSIIKPINALIISNIDLFFLVGISLLLFPFLRSKYTLKREDGIFMILIYMVYIYYLWPK